MAAFGASESFALPSNAPNPGYIGNVLPQGGSPNLIVQGKILRVDGTPVSVMYVRAVDVDIRNEEQLGVSPTAKTGDYKISYCREQFARQEKESADLKLYVHQSAGCNDNPIAISKVMFNVAPVTTIDIVIDGDAVVGPSEFARLRAEILPLLGSMSPADIVEDDQHQDVTFLVGETKQEEQRIRFFATAYQHQNRVKVRAEIFYGLFRENISTDLPTLLNETEESLVKALQAAIDANIISQISDMDVRRIAAQLHTLGLQSTINNPTGRTPVGSVLSTATDKPEMFMDVLSDHDGSIQDFWKNLDTKQEFKGKVPALQFSVQLGVITLCHTPLVKELQAQQKAGTISSLQDLAKFNLKKWTDLVSKQGIGAPNIIPGDTSAAKAQNYAKGIARVVEDTFPTQFIMNRLSDADDDTQHGPLPNKSDLTTFFSENPKFSFTTTRIPSFLASNPSAFDGIKDVEGLKANLSSMQRVYRAAPQYTQMRALVSSGIKSSMQITQMGPKAFAARYGARVGGAGEAARIYERASQAHAMSYNLLTSFGNAASLIPTHRWPDWGSILGKLGQAETGVPDWATLFGSVDMCSCVECRSTDGPAAYFVDILHFLNQRLLIDKIARNSSGEIESVTYKKRTIPGTHTQADKSAKDVLFERRPDLGDIELSCQNTNTPIPYIDLTNEALENAVSPPSDFAPFTLPDDATQKLDSCSLDGLQNKFSPPLSIFAAVVVMKAGEWWTIDELSFTYTIRLEKSKVQVVARSLQTKGTAKERAANAQYINLQAYDILRTQVYPWRLPFDLGIETVRTYLAHVGIGRYELMEVFLSGSRQRVLTDPAIVHEFLGLTTFEAKLVKAEVTGEEDSETPGPWNLWGFRAKDLSAENGIPDPADKSKMIITGDWVSVLTERVDVFLQQSGITYKELLNIVEVGDIFGGEIAVDIRPQKGQPADTCDLSKLSIRGIGIDELQKILQYVRLAHKLNDWGILDLGKVFKALSFPSGPAEMDGFLVKVSHVRRLMRALNLPLEFVLAFWTPIETTEYKDHENGDEDAQKESLFSRIFRNQTISKQPDEVFTGNPNDLTGTISEHSSPIAAALSISPVDFGFLIADPNILTADVLSIENLSKLFRHVILAKALGVTQKDYLSLLRLVSANPFADVTDTVLFVERVQSALDSGFSLVELNYLLRHDFTVESSISPTDESLALILDDIRTGLRKIVIENTFDADTVDNNGDLTKKKLALLNWDSTVISQAVGILNNTAAFSVSLADPPSSATAFPAELQDKISYDANTQRLTYSRVMTNQERDTLKQLSGVSPQFIVAVEELYLAPRTFFARYMRTMSIPDFSVDLASLPAGVKIPVSLRKKVYFDSTPGKLHSVGALSESERQVLLNLATGSGANGTFIAAVTALYNAPNSIVPVAGDEFVAVADVASWFDSAADSTGTLLTPAMRFRVVLQKLLPYLLEKLSNQLIRQKVGEVINVNSQIVENLLLTWVNVSSNPVISVFRSPAYAESNEKSPVIRSAFPDQFFALTLLTKIGMVINKLRLSALQLDWIFTYRKRPGDPTTAWLDLNLLPLSSVASAIHAFSGWERLYSLTRLRDSLNRGEKLLNEIFTAARQSSGTFDQIVQLLATDLKVQAGDLVFLVGPDGLNLTFPAAFQNEVGMTRIFRAWKLFREMGATPSVGKQAAQLDISELAARAIKQAVKSKYEQATWDTVAAPLSNILRDAQRAALVAYLLAHPISGTSLPWRTANDLYAHFLMDVEMGPCQKTSRIKQAICSVQLFAQRCLTNLEPEVQANEEADGFWAEWDWMKSFRVAGANREVFERPENFLESSVRDDKTQFFVELESELQQADITQETAEAALLNYLEKLDQVSRMEVVSFFHQEEFDGHGNRAVDVIHIFARTRGKPQRYFYCKRVDKAYWTGWEKIDVDIQGDHLIPVVWNRRLYLFWAIFTEKQKKVPIRLPRDNESLPPGETFWEIKLAWTERKQSKWLPKVISDAYLTVPKSGSAFEEEDMVVRPGRSLITFKASPNPDTGELIIRCLNPAPTGLFYFNGIRGQPEARYFFLYVTGNSSDNFEWWGHLLELLIFTVVTPAQSKILNMWFGEGDTSDGQLWVRTDRSEKMAILRKTPGGKYNIAIGHQDLQFQSQRPFWFQHDQKSFFVEPRDRISYPTPWLTYPSSIHPSLLDGSIVRRYYDTSIFRRPSDIYRRPDEVGANRYSPTFELKSSLNAVYKAPSVEVTASTSTATSSPFVATAVYPQLRDVVTNFDPVRRINTDFLRIPPVKSTFQTKLFKFSTFYHPFVSEMIRTLNRDGIDGLYQRRLQQAHNESFETDYVPNYFHIVPKELPIESVDFDDNVFAVYNWELFFHVPVMIAERLSKNQKFKEAQKWFHYVFDPTDTSPGLSVPKRYWKTKKLFDVSDEDYAKQTIKAVLNFLAKGGDPAEREKLTAEEFKYLELLEQNVARWRKDPFKPFMVARARVTAFQKSVVMKYLDNLIAWGDVLFRGDTIELINEATQIYILAADLLGQRPVEMAARAIPQVQTYNSLEPKLDAYSNTLAAVEELVPPGRQESTIMPTKPLPPVTSPSVTYFCVRKNEKLLAYWDTVADRLFKIRHCMNLKGIVRELPLFEPPIDPAVLIRAVASGADLSSSIGDLNAPLPHHRYFYLAGKATELCQELKSLGTEILTNLEKKDASQLALLQSGQSMQLLDAVKFIRQKQVDDSLLATQVLERSKEVILEKHRFYDNKALMNPWEITHMAMEGASMVLSLIDGGTQAVSGTLHLIPDAKLGAPTSIGVTIGGTNIGASSSKFAKFLEKSSIVLSKSSTMVATTASFVRRKEDWDLQFRLANKELGQLNSQIESAKVRTAMAEKELENHNLQIKHAKDTDEFLMNKYTNNELYNWMLSQLATTYFQTYQLAYETAKRAERAFGFELGVKQPDFITFNYWDSMRKGLTAAERLFCDIKRMDMGYLDQDLREYEISRSISLAQLDPVALIQLRQSGSCFFNVPEAIFDLDFPGHYMRRIKAVTLTIPCVSGPYISVSSTLSLLQSSIRTANTLSGGKYARRDNDIRFTDSYGQFQSIVTSTGINDAGLFETNLRDERYLPFERSGAISSWKLEIPTAFKQYDYDTISDVILHIRYTSREGGAALGAQASTELKQKALDAIAIAESQNGLARLFDLPRAFPDIWLRFLRGTTTHSDNGSPVTKQEAILPLTSIQFPYLFSGAKGITITKVSFFVRIKPAFLTSHTPDSLTFTFSDSRISPGGPLTLSAWNSSADDTAKGKVYRASKTLEKPLGNFYLKGSLNNGTASIDMEAIGQFLLVCHYSVKWV